MKNNMKNIVFAAMLVALMSAPAQAASLSISSMTIPTSASQGDSFTITMSVLGSSVSDVTGSLTIPSGITCTPSGTQTISLDGSGVGSASWSCSASIAGDYSNQITASVTGTDGSTTYTDSEQTGLTVLSPASITTSSTISSSSVASGSSVTFTVGVNNVGDTATTYSISFSCPTGTSCSPSSVASNSISGNSLENNQVTVTGSTAGTYTITATISSPVQADSTTSKSLTVTSSGAANATAGSGSGGGAGSSNATTSTASITINAANLSIKYNTVAALSEATANILLPNVTGISKVTFTTSITATNVTILVNKIDSKPSSVVGNPGTNVYKYIEIQKINLFDSTIRTVSMDFQVEKSWLTANSIDPARVYLNRYANGLWSKLTTTKLSEDSSVVKYTAQSTGFSYFAITGETLGAPVSPGEPPATTPPAEQPDLGTAGNQTINETGTPGQPFSIDTNLAVGIVVLIIVIVIAFKFALPRMKERDIQSRTAGRRAR